MSAKIIAIIVASVIVIGGAGTATAIILMNDNGDDDNYGVDVVRTDLQVGDYMKFKIESHMTHESSAENVNKEVMFDEIYHTDGGTLVPPPENVTYKGHEVLCNVYTYDNRMYIWADVSSGFIYKTSVIYHDGRITYMLKDTNIDPSLDRGSQTVSSGSFVLYEYDMVVSHSTGTCSGTYKLWMEDFSGSTGTYCDFDDRNVDLKITYTVASIDAANNTLKIEHDDDDHPTSWYLSYISKDQFTTYHKDVLGQDLTWDEKQESVIYPPFGKRDVYSQMANINFGMMDAVQYNLTYGEEGVIYYYTTLSMDSILEGMQMELIESSLISQK